MRESLNIRIACADCGNPIEWDGDKKAFDSHGAHELGIALVAKPCTHCVGEARRPLEMFQAAINAATRKEASAV